MFYRFPQIFATMPAAHHVKNLVGSAAAKSIATEAAKGTVIVSETVA
jgi:hypothetical protein